MEVGSPDLGLNSVTPAKLPNLSAPQFPLLQCRVPNINLTGPEKGYE